MKQSPKVKYFIAIVTFCIALVVVFSSNDVLTNNGTNGSVSNEAEPSNAVAIQDPTQSAPKAIQLDQDICLEEFELMLNQEQAKNKKYQLEQFVVELDSKAISPKVINHVFTSTGIGKNTGYKLLGKLTSPQMNNLIPRYKTSIYGDQLAELMAIVTNGDIDAFITFYKNLDKEKRVGILIKDDILTPYQLLLDTQQASNIDSDNWEKLNAAIHELKQQGISTHFSDIVDFTASSVPLDIIERLLDGQYEQLNSTFLFSSEIHNLVTLSTELGDIDHIEYWLAQGISPTPFKYRKNAMDYALTLPTNENAESIIELLLEYQLSPHEFLTRNELDALMVELPNIKPDVLTEYLLGELSTKELKQATALVNHVFNLIGADLTLPENCLFLQNSLKKAVRKILSSDNEEQPSQLTNIEANKQRSLSTPDNKLGKEKATEINKGDESRQNTIRQANLIKAGKWRQVMQEQLAKVDITEQEELAASLGMAIYAGCKKSDIVELLDRGLVADDIMAKIIVADCDLDVIKLFDSKGFNFHYRYDDGTNAIMSIVGSEYLDKLKYLIGQGVSVNTLNNGTGNQNEDYPYINDPLKIAIVGVQFDPLGTQVIDLLLNAGAEVTQQHSYILKSNMASDLDSYLTLIANHPNLKLKD